MTIAKKFALVLVSALLMLSCEKVEKLSDNVKLVDFKVLSHSPADIELGEPYMDADTVFIPVLRGISLFPLSISVEPTADGNTKHILLGNSFSSFSDIVFQQGGIDDKIFYLIAKSGIAKPYYIKLDVGNQNTEGEFKQLDIVSSSVESVLLPPQAYINPLNKHIAIHGIGYQFPITINAAATLSDNAEIKDAELLTQSSSQLSLSFNSISDTLLYTVEAQSGNIEKWKVFLNAAEPVTGSETGDILTAVAIQKNRLTTESQTAGYNILETTVSFSLGEVTFNIVPGTDFSELKLLPTAELPTNSYMLKLENATPISFASYDDSHSFYVLDNRTGYYKEWTYKILAGDITDVIKFVFTYDDTPSGSGQILLSENAEIDNTYNIITLYATKISPAHFPLAVTPTEVEVSPGASHNMSTMSFTAMNDEYDFKVWIGSKEEFWKVILKPAPTINTEADVEGFVIESSSLPSLTNNEINIYKEKAEITIDIIDKSASEAFNPKLQIKPIIALSDGADFTDYTVGSIIEFSTFQDIITFTVQAQNGTSKQWKVRLVNKPQLPNADFELWKMDGSFPTIDPFPGVGLGWATANNSFVKGTMPASNAPNGNAAEMTTDIVNNVLIKNLITAGTLYVGQFKLSLDMGNPRSMTKFGIPFEAYPTAIKIDAKYQPGEKLQRSVLLSGMKYELHDVEGQDKGQIWVELVNWSGSGNIDYAGTPKETIKVLARGEYDFIGASGWNRITIPFEKTASYDLYPVTHIVIVMASSFEGHLFLGAKGSKLTVDNIELVY
ncbi:MAG: PCMD domain-containing protein [Prevotellaceae bacterium]|jgi:hypothetical protein|nr:PCMD domain-containing protein [Prevotellaceae bacterium]